MDFMPLLNCQIHRKIPTRTDPKRPPVCDLRHPHSTLKQVPQKGYFNRVNRPIWGNH